MYPSLPEQVTGEEDADLALLDRRLPGGPEVQRTLREGSPTPCSSPSNCSLLREDSQAEVSFLVWLKGARDEDIVSRGQLEAA